MACKITPSMFYGEMLTYSADTAKNVTAQSAGRKMARSCDSNSLNYDKHLTNGEMRIGKVEERRWKKNERPFA
jgi:hypothetical protein